MTFVLAVNNTPDTVAGKCKDPAHVDAIPTGFTGGDGPGVWTVTKIAHGSCSNDPTYRGPVYVLTRNGQPGMQMYPDLKAVLPGELRQAASGRSVVIRHTINTRFVTYARLTLAEANDLANRIAAA